MEHASILAAEVTDHDAVHLARCLTTMGLKFEMARTPEMVFDLLQTVVFNAAVVAAEANTNGRSLTACLSDWPGIQRIVAVGPSGHCDTERHALTQGAHAYVCRPVTIRDLAVALRTIAPASAVPKEP